MKVTIRDTGITLPEDCHTVILTLDNGNRIRIFEIDSGTIQIENITIPGDCGFHIYPESYGALNITPEG